MAGGYVVEAPWRAKVQAAGTLLVAAAVTVLGLAAVYSGLHTSAEIQAYQSAGTCAAPADALSGGTCRYTGTGTVTGTSTQSALEVDLTVSSLPGHSFVATFPFNREPDQSALTTGATAPAEVWNGQVTEYAGVKSAQEPEYSVQGLAPIGLGFVIAGLFVMTWGAYLARQAWRR